jgi:hypothetical protein
MPSVAERCSTTDRRLFKNFGLRLGPGERVEPLPGCCLGGVMDTISVPWSRFGASAKRRAQFERAPRKEVPVLYRFGGLAVTPTTGLVPGFTVTHVATGCCVPSLVGLPFDTAINVAKTLVMSFPWEEARDVFFFRDLTPPHQEALCGCIIAIREMFGIE